MPVYETGLGHVIDIFSESLCPYSLPSWYLQSPSLVLLCRMFYLVVPTVVHEETSLAKRNRSIRVTAATRDKSSHARMRLHSQFSSSTQTSRNRLAELDSDLAQKGVSLFVPWLFCSNDKSPPHLVETKLENIGHGETCWTRPTGSLSKRLTFFFSRNRKNMCSPAGV